MAHLKIQLQAELNLPARRCTARQFPKRRVVGIARATRSSNTCQRRTVCARQEKGRRVGQVEEFRTELEHRTFAEADVLEDGKVSIRRPRATCDSTRRVTEQLDRCPRAARNGAGNSKCCRIEVRIDAGVRQDHRLT